MKWFLWSIVFELGVIGSTVADDLRDIATALESYCFECHDALIAEGEIDLETAVAQRPLVKNLRLWENVIERVRNGEMPPPDGDAPQPSERFRRGFVDALVDEVERFDYETLDDPGYESARRLTHLEFENAVSDLLGMRLDLKEGFPPDLSGESGFDNSANTLFLQPELFDRYVAAVEVAMDTAFPEKAQTQAHAVSRLQVAGTTNFDQWTPSAAREAIGTFARRAFRRPVGAPDVDPYFELYSSGIAAGLGVHGAFRKALSAILVAPDFLLKTEAEPERATSTRVSGIELASRLSFFVWASIPDEPLLALGESGALLKTSVLDRQVERMLADSRAKSLGTVFAAQWLGFDDLGKRIRLDPIDNPWCTDTLMAAMRAESALFFLSLLRENQPLSRMLDADYTYMNEELGDYYDRDVPGDGMRRVALNTERRGGILGHASVLAITSFPDRTSPVARGKWILESLLGTPPPPPPPDAGDLEEAEERFGEMTLREQLAAHRRSPRCAGCHQEMDPLGLSLENYDRFGAYRRRYDEGEGRRVDARGQLPDGTAFEGLPGLRQALLDTKYQDLARQLTRKMLAYALGRQLEYYDEKTVREIVRHLEASAIPLQDLVKQVVSSYPFQYKMKRPQN